MKNSIISSDYIEKTLTFKYLEISTLFNYCSDIYPFVFTFIPILCDLTIKCQKRNLN